MSKCRGVHHINSDVIQAMKSNKKSRKKQAVEVPGVDLRSVLVGLLERSKETSKLMNDLLERNKEWRKRDDANYISLILMEQEILRMEPDIAHDVFERLINVATQVTTFIAGEQPRLNTGVSDWFRGSPNSNYLVDATNITDFDIKSRSLGDRRNGMSHPKDVAELNAAVLRVRDAVNRHRPFMFEEYGEDEDFKFAVEVISKWEETLMQLAAEEV